MRAREADELGGCHCFDLKEEEGQEGVEGENPKASYYPDCRSVAVDNE